MRIQNNLPGINTHRLYTERNKKTAKSAAKLSSGYRINCAADDAAGLAISEKMRSQIRGLSMAAKNTQDALSLIQTAEGALEETHNLLQRMNELSVEAATGTNEKIDRIALAKEYEQLKREIDDIAEGTTFNNMHILDGSLSYEGYTRTAFTAGVYAIEEAGNTPPVNAEIRFKMSDWFLQKEITTYYSSVSDGVSGFELMLSGGTGTGDKTGSLVDTNRLKVSFLSTDGDFRAEDFTIEVNKENYEIVIRQKEPQDLSVEGYEVNEFSDYRLASGNGVATAEFQLTDVMLNHKMTQGSLTWYVGTSGNRAEQLQVQISGTGNTLRDVLEDPDVDVRVESGEQTVFGAAENIKGSVTKNGCITLTWTTSSGTPQWPAGFMPLEIAAPDSIQLKNGVSPSENPDASPYRLVEIDFWKLQEGDQVDVQIGGETVSIIREAGMTREEFEDRVARITADMEGVVFKGSAIFTTRSVSKPVLVRDGLQPYDTNALRIQVGALENEQLSLSIHSMNTEGLGIEPSHLRTQESAGNAITAVRKAVNIVSDLRTTLGATQNRLEHKLANLRIGSENLSASESRIRDIDMASEMAEFTKNSVLQQAATAMLAQANALPQSILSLLG